MARDTSAIEIFRDDEDGIIHVEMYAADGTTTGGVEIHPDGKIVASMIDGVRPLASASWKPEGG